MSRYAHAIYCDDIRQELGSKLSLMGIYQGKMFVPSFPIVLSKLCVAVWAVTPIDRPFTKLTLRLLHGDKVVLEAPLPDEFLNTQGNLVETLDPVNPKTLTAHTAIQLSPLPIEGPVSLKLRIQTEQEELRAGGLEIELAAQEQLTGARPA